MILFTGSGFLASEFARQFDCKIVSARSLSDAELEKMLMVVDTVIHNAAKIECSDIIDGADYNFLLTKRILDLIYRVKPSIKVIFISSMSILETQYEYKDVNAMSAYAFSKYLSEIYCIKHPLVNITCVRFSTIFYKNPNKDGLSKLIHDSYTTQEVTVYNEGMAKRDFIPINIAVQYLQKLVNGNGPKKVNIASGNPISFLDVANEINKIIPITIKNVNTANGAILHEFSMDTISNIGEINFSLTNEIRDYVNKLRNEDINL